LNILVTGSTGFIGNKLVHRLAENQHYVTATGRSKTNTLPEYIKYKVADLLFPEDCHQVVQGADIVIHCAGVAGAWGAWDRYQKGNIVSTENLLEACKKSGVSCFINLSSPSVYFDYKDQFNLTESFVPKRFSNHYARSKYLAEQLVYKSQTDDFKIISLRPRGVIGAGDKNWLPRIIDMQKAKRLIKPGSKGAIVDFTSIENLLDAIELCLETSRDNWGHCYNITNGRPENLWDVIGWALHQMDMATKIKTLPRPFVMALARASEYYHQLRQSEKEPSLLPIKVGVASYSMTMDISKAQKKLGYKPKISTKQSINNFTHWWKSLQG